jgi:hypothetical protein
MKRISSIAASLAALALQLSTGVVNAEDNFA